MSGQVVFLNEKAKCSYVSNELFFQLTKPNEFRSKNNHLLEETKKLDNRITDFRNDR